MIATILIGLVVGIIAKFLMPGRDPGGFIITILLGIAGSAIATYLGRALGFYQIGESAGFIAAVIGAVILLFVYRLLTGRKG
ncbi:MAG: GlsB/YeaQ/YmgE family stress response membrane protein [Comamonadaceae bacterium]|nr:MAG: GlsB/YeaQ/YmgE family stress response membrane protein [Comamonadaceae bacterium]